MRNMSFFIPGTGSSRYVRLHCIRGPEWLLVEIALMVLVLILTATSNQAEAVPIPASQHSLSTLAQDDSSIDADEVPPKQVAKYIAVYKAMQHNRSLNVETAAAQQGMSVQAFRILEGRIERDDAAMQHVRDELQASARRSSPDLSKSTSSSQ